MLEVNLEENLFNINPSSKGTMATGSLDKKSTSASNSRESQIEYKLTLIELKKILSEEKLSLNPQLAEQIRILLLLLNDLTGGVIKLGEVCSINRMKYYENFEVNLNLSNVYSYGYHACYVWGLTMNTQIIKLFSLFKHKEKEQR